MRKSIKIRDRKARDWGGGGGIHKEKFWTSSDQDSTCPLRKQTLPCHLTWGSYGVCCKGYLWRDFSPSLDVLKPPSGFLSSVRASLSHDFLPHNWVKNPQLDLPSRSNSYLNGLSSPNQACELWSGRLLAWLVVPASGVRKLKLKQNKSINIFTESFVSGRVRIAAFRTLFFAMCASICVWQSYWPLLVPNNFFFLSTFQPFSQSWLLPKDIRNESALVKVSQAETILSR